MGRLLPGLALLTHTHRHTHTHTHTLSLSLSALDHTRSLPIPLILVHVALTPATRTAGLPNMAASHSDRQLTNNTQYPARDVHSKKGKQNQNKITKQQPNA